MGSEGLSIETEGLTHPQKDDFDVANWTTLSSQHRGIAWAWGVAADSMRLGRFRTFARRAPLHGLSIDPRFGHLNGIDLSFVDDLEKSGWAGEAVMVLFAVVFPG